MRVLALVLLLLLPSVQAGGQLGDLIVQTREGALPPPGAIPLHVFPGYVLLAATPLEEAALRASRDVLRVDRAEPLSLDASAPARAARDHALRLTRADAESLAPFHADGSGVTVAIVDSGIDVSHPDLAGRVKGAWALANGVFVPSSTDLNGHGTHVAGIVAASGASSQGAIVGVAPGASLVGLDIMTQFTTASATLAYDWLHVHHAEHGIRVATNAWGRTGADRVFDPGDPEIRAIDRVVDDGVVVVFAASNHGPGTRTLSLEAQDPRVVTVGATDDAATLMEYSSRGPVTPVSGPAWTKPDVVAPGERIVGLKSAQAAPDGADPDPLHRVLSGTSQAAPHVAGIVARMLQLNATMTPRDVQDALRQSAIDLGAPGPDPVAGYGVVDAPDAMRLAQGAALQRDSPLAAGGTDAYDDAAPLAAAQPNALLAPASRDVWTTTIPVKPGAQGLSFEIFTGAPAAGLEARLEGPDRREGPWSDTVNEGGRTLLRGRVQDLPPGVYTLTLRATLPAAAQIASHVEVVIGPNATRSHLTDPRYHEPAAQSVGAPQGPGVTGWVLAAVASPVAAAVAYAVARKRQVTGHLTSGAGSGDRSPAPPAHPAAAPSDPQGSRDGLL